MNLASDDRLKTITRGDVIIGPDDAAISKIRSKFAKKGCHQDSILRGWKSPNCESKGWVKKATESFSVQQGHRRTCWAAAL